MTLDEYKQKLQEIAKKHSKFERGVKYINRWDYYLKEKQFILQQINFKNIKTALDIGTGIGVLPVLLQQKGIIAEGSDIDEEITGPLFKECCDVAGFKRFSLCIKPQTAMNIDTYDLILASRTEFDRQFTCEEDWLFFIDDAMKHCKLLFLKLNTAGKSPGCVPKWIKDQYMFWPRGQGKPIRAWYLKVDSKSWKKSRARAA